MTKSIELLFLSHFTKSISKDLKKFTIDHALLHSRYLFTRREKSLQYGYCTHCRKEYQIKAGSKLKHGQDWKCEKCKSLVMVKASGRGRSRLIDDVYLNWYSKSLVDPQSITVTTYIASRDYRHDYENVQTEFKPVGRYLFEPGKATMLRREFFISGIFYSRRVNYESDWYFTKNVHSIIDTVMSYKDCIQAVESIHAAVAGTPFQYCEWGKYLKDKPNRDLVEYFALFSKYPCVEYLMKLGMQPIIESKLSGYSTYGAIDWHGKSIDKVLRLSKHEAKEWVKQPFKAGLLSLFSYQKFKRLGLNLSFEEAHLVCGLADRDTFKQVKAQSGRAPIEVIVKYMIKQLNRKGSYKSSSAQYAFNDWKDYLRECEELGMDLSEIQVLFPNNLHTAHQSTSQKIKYKRDVELDQKIENRAKQVDKKYRFAYQEFFIRSAASNAELFQEGKILNHCVGGYSKNYADGSCDLLLVRRKSEPDKPFYTMQISNGVISQCRGLRNCEMTEEVKQFVDLFKSEKIVIKKTNRKKVAV